jgi:Xaa-Pro aminopeptidase
MGKITSEKLSQAVALVQGAGVDAWITFVRETAGGGDPVLPLLIDGGLTWQSALLVLASGEKIAILGNYDADPLKESGDWTEVIPYVQGIREPLLATLHRFISNPRPKIAVNFSPNDVKADGLSYGMYLLLQRFVEGTKFEGCFVSAEDIVLPLRGRKSLNEVAAMKGAITETELLFEEIGAFAHTGISEREVFRFVQKRINEKGFGYSWDQAADPIVNSGPNSMIGHGIASDSILIEPGHVFHIDLGITKNSYSSDLQRCWFVLGEAEPEVPENVLAAFHAVNAAITAGADMLKPGVQGWEVDAAARASLTGHGYEEYLHALGHQVGRVAHDGGAILGPRWERYGKTPEIPIQENEVYTLELGVIMQDRGYLGLEDMVVVRSDGIEWLSRRQTEMWTIR